MRANVVRSSLRLRKREHAIDTDCIPEAIRRQRKEAPICGLTCSCCYHTILGSTKRRRACSNSVMSRRDVLSMVESKDAEGVSKEEEESKGQNSKKNNKEILLDADLHKESPQNVDESYLVKRRKSGEEVHIAAKAPRQRSCLSSAESCTDCDGNDALESDQLYAIKGSEMQTLWSMRSSAPAASGQRNQDLRITRSMAAKLTTLKELDEVTDSDAGFPPSNENASTMGDDEAESVCFEENTRKARVLRPIRRRRRKLITMRKARRKPLGTIFGSPRQKIEIDEWVEEGKGMYTRDAVILFDRVQSEVEKSRIQKLSPNGSIEVVNLGGKYEIKTSYCGNYPAEYSALRALYVCDGCFSYFAQQQTLFRHMIKCLYRYAPPGNEIYRDEERNVSVFEVHGKSDAMYCSNLCRLTMLWLENKVIFMDVEPFNFYILTMFLDGGFRALGYFSKQCSYLKHNLSCFCIFPCYQGKGYGTFLIDLKRPFSAKGLIVYKKYWCSTLIQYLYLKALDIGWENLQLTLAEVAKDTGIEISDIIESLTGLCDFEWTRNYRSLIIKITEQSIMDIGRHIVERNAKKLSANVQNLTPLFEQSGTSLWPW
ncbi:unnamed protein product [Cylicocyclus nassatus]|uniref:Histone acetyltransferase n=1 Tax=Cylicocyclus nassatus TaxID=53992 RepID=A0AA36GLD0_CYLNA|nr:unnamed protein product [Cylicocyclus nassatus]